MKMNILMYVKSRGTLVYYVTAEQLSFLPNIKKYYRVYNQNNENIATYTLKENAFIFATEHALQEYKGNIEVIYTEQRETIIYRDYAVFEDIRPQR